MTRQHFIGSALVVGLAAAGLSACALESAEPAPEAGVISGGCQTVFGGEVCSWGTMTDGVVTAIGVTVPMATIEGAPMDGPMVFPPVPDAIVALPAQIAAATGFNHLGVNWELHGHPPALFMTPHFDFHFYTDTAESVAGVDCADLRKPAALPAAYALPDIEIPGMGTLVGLCVPGMGMHAIPSAEVELTDPFQASMIVGYYGARLTFIEPMISRARLMAGTGFSIAVPPAPSGLPSSVRWPSAFEAAYDADARTYRLTFTLPRP